jgi:hypothetical protein|tara:strand:- start:1287 stop:1649 length:363 start_codon:yes stop_codon:yes gene_type:complete
MAVTSILSTEEEIKAKGGANVSSSITDAQYDGWVLQAETFVNAFTRVNYSDSFASLNVDVKHLLSDVVSSLVAINSIMYDMSGYTSRQEAESMINVLRDSALRGLSVLRDKKNQTFINDA